MLLANSDRRVRGAALLAKAALLFVLFPASAPAQTRWVIDGHGSGHGVGMSQYGAYGYALRGSGYRSILAHYYRGTSIGGAAESVVRVLIAASTGDVRFSRATAACGLALDSSRSYRAHRGGGGVQLLSGSGQPLARCGAKLRANGQGRILIAGQGAYRGALEVVPAPGGSLNVVNAVSVDRYVQGVIAQEVSADWPLAALRAQAVAARSYALTSRVHGNDFTLYSDTRSQVYGGIAAESARTNLAAQSTAGQVVTYRGRTAETFFFSCSGGRTENIEFAFIGSAPLPYLKSVIDPYDGSCPLHSWRRTLSEQEMNSRLGSALKGRLLGVRITKRGISPRIVWAKLIGGGGNSAIRGDQLAAALGLDSTWASFTRVG